MSCFSRVDERAAEKHVDLLPPPGDATWGNNEFTDYTTADARENVYPEGRGAREGEGPTLFQLTIE